MYKNKYNNFHGKIGITLNSRYFFPKDGLNKTLTERGMQYMLGWFAHPLLSAKGGYPTIMINEIAKNSLAENRSISRLPFMNTEMKKFIRGSIDYLSFNYYTSNIVEYNLNYMEMSSGWDKDSRLILQADTLHWKQAKTVWIYDVPEGFRRVLKWVHNQYDNPEILITENGWSDEGQLNDTDRIDYLRGHVKEVLRAMRCYGSNIVGYGVWSLLDNFEWLSGFTEHFGLFAVNYSSPNKERIPKRSTQFVKKIIELRKIPLENY